MINYYIRKTIKSNAGSLSELMNIINVFKILYVKTCIAFLTLKQKIFPCQKRIFLNFYRFLTICSQFFITFKEKNRKTCKIKTNYIQFSITK